jgi:peptide/nickel transport system ATP-binding protein
MSAPSTQPMIEIENLSISFGHGADRVDAVKTVSFSVAAGESYGLVGESGSGKSTILRALAGLNPFWSGHMAIGGQKLTGKRPRALRRLVQMVFQDPFGSLHPKHTVDRILSEPLAIHGFDDVETRVRAALERVGLGPSFRFRYPHQLSGGQRQRVAIARALILEPKVVLLDEPTSALDVSIQAEVLNLLTDLRQQLGLTYVLVSHDLGVVAHMCKRLSIMRTGDVVETASADDLSEGRLLHAYSRQLLIASRGYDTAAIAAFGDF